MEGCDEKGSINVLMFTHHFHWLGFELQGRWYIRVRYSTSSQSPAITSGGFVMATNTGRNSGLMNACVGLRGGEGEGEGGEIGQKDE